MSTLQSVVAVVSKKAGNSSTSLFCVAQLLDTKSTDRKITLLHYIALIVKEKYPELANFYNEMHFVDKAAAGEFTHPVLSFCVRSGFIFD